MNIPLVIHFHGLEKSDAIEARIRERCDWLAKRFARMTHCNVHVDALNRNAHKGKLVQVKVDVGIPGRNPLVVSAERDANNAQDAIGAAIQDAFASARRQLDAVAERITTHVKAERSRRRPARTTPVE